MEIPSDCLSLNCLVVGFVERPSLRVLLGAVCLAGLQVLAVCAGVISLLNMDKRTCSVRRPMHSRELGR